MSDEHPTTKPARSAWLLFFRIAIPLVLLLGVLFTFLFTTERGLRFTVHMAGTLLPGKLHIEKVQGQLSGIIHFEKFDYENKHFQLRIKDLEFAWKPWRLLLGKLTVNYLNAQTTYFKIKYISAYQPRLLEINSPVKLEIKNINFNYFQIQPSPVEKPILIKSLILSDGILTPEQLKMTLKTQVVLPQAWLKYPLLQAERQYPLLQSELDVSGSPEEYQWALRLKSRALDWTARGRGDKKQVIFTSAQDNSFRGLLKLSGKLQWYPFIQWEGKMQAQKINLGAQWPRYPSNINFILHGQGIHQNGEIELEQLQGTIRNFPLQGQVKIAFNEGELTAFDGQLQLKDTALQLHGKIDGLWNVGWNLDAPTLNTVFPDLTGNLQTRGIIQGDLKNPHILLDGEIKNLNHKGKQLAELIFWNVRGSVFQGHRLNMTWKINQDQNIQLALQGIVKNPPSGLLSWQATLQQLNLYTKQFGNWHLQQTAPLNLTFSNFMINPSCLITDGQKICFAGQWRFPGGKQKSASSLSGKLTGELTRFDRITSLIPNLKNFQGKMNAALTLSGTFKQPVISGKILFNASAALPKYGLHLAPIQLIANIAKSRLQYAGKIHTGGNALNITGTTDLNKAGFPTLIQLQGSNLLVYNTHQYQIYANPNLTIQTLGTQINARGQIFIPKAKIMPYQFDKSISLPEEVVFIHGGKIQTPKSPYQIDSQVHLILGKDVELDAFDLKGDLEGELLITHVSQQAATAKGYLAIIDGEYKTYDTTLKIKQGLLEFKGGPINNPLVNAQAVREVKGTSRGRSSFSTRKYTVGVNISGTLKHPKKSLFSQPSGLSQQQIMSYLVFGGASLTDRLHISYGIDYLEQPTTVVRIQYELDEHWSIQSEISSVGTGIDLLYNIEKP
jgi:autotransporter translocation and assembly factor TamB